MRKPRAVLCAAAVCGALLIAVGAPAQTSITLTPEQQREFLLTARVINSRLAGKGITGSMRLTLADGRVTHDASFQSIEDRTSLADRARGRRRAGEVNFVDSYKYNIAAYELARLLGLGEMMPVTVERRWNGKVGSLSWWVDDVLMDETEREKTGTDPPSPLQFQRQRYRMDVFAELVHDTDRNKGNVMYTRDWRVIMIDFSRAFRTAAALRVPAALTQIDRTLYSALQTLTAADVERVAGQHLTRSETDAIVARRQLIVDRFARLIRERGEGSVLY